MTPVPDITPPYVVSTYPANNSIGIDISTKIMITFSEPMDKNATENAISITPFLNITKEWNSNGTTITLAALLLEGTTYTIVISTRAKDMFGNAMTSEYSFSFKTKMSEELSISPLGPVTFVVVIDIMILILLLYAKNKMWRKRNQHKKKKLKSKKK